MLMAKAALNKGFIAPGLSRGLMLEHEKQALAINNLSLLRKV